MKQWYITKFYGDSEELLELLNMLNDYGIQPNHILVTSSSFGGKVLYYSDKPVEKVMH